MRIQIAFWLCEHNNTALNLVLAVIVLSLHRYAGSFDVPFHLPSSTNLAFSLRSNQRLYVR